jgi:diguanylate cyclase (GGDEF)-like protein
MNEKIISVVTTLLLVAIAARLVIERRRLEPRHRAFDLLVLGAVLVAGGSILDVLDVELLAPRGSLFTAAIIVVERVLGYMLGITLIGVGLLLWVPALAQYQQQVGARLLAERELQRSARDVASRNQALELLNDLSERLHRSLDLDEIARQTTAVMVRVSDPPLVAVYLLAERGDRLRLAADHGFDEATRKAGETLHVDGSLTGQALAERQLLVADDVETDARMQPDIRAALVRHGIGWAAAVPLVYHERSLGSINVVHTSRPDDVDVYLDTLRSIGQTVSLAIANAQHVAGLEHRAFRDSLTDLPNRAQLHRDFAAYRLRDYERGLATGLSLIDLDHFKDVNDTLGHHVGDKLLVQLAHRLSDELDAQGHVLHRLGGDEFAILIAGLRDTAHAVEATRDILAMIRRPFRIEGMTLEIGASAGVALAPDHGVDSHELLRCADVAMYQAKRASEGVALYDPDHDRHSPRRLELIAELGEAIRSGHLELHYQPVIALRNRRVTGLEALVRWRHPELGLLPPAEFIPLAEVGDLIHPLTTWVTDTALAQLRTWSDRGHDLTMAVNLSTRTLLDREGVGRLIDTIRSHGVEPGRVEFEVTETALLADAETASRTLCDLHDAGVRIAIDDFGTGYSSLTSLRRFPVDTLKIDRSFITDLLNDRTSDAIVRSVIALARRLDIRVVAEGVEDQTTLTALETLGCDEAQGFLIAEPDDADRITRFLDHPGTGRTLPPRRPADHRD